jgi:hypothetical protein
MGYREDEFYKYYWRQFIIEPTRYEDRLIEAGYGPDTPFYRIVDRAMRRINRSYLVKRPIPAENADTWDYEVFLAYLFSVGGIAKVGDRAKLIERCNAWLSRRQKQACWKEVKEVYEAEDTKKKNEDNGKLRRELPVTPARGSISKTASLPNSATNGRVI